MIVGSGDAAGAVAPPEAFPAGSLRSLLRSHAAAVVVVTTSGDRPVGVTVTTFVPVSLAPPLVAFCLDRCSSSLAAVMEADFLGFNLLEERQRGVAEVFADRGVDRLAVHHDWRHGPEGVPLLGGTLAGLVCRNVDQISAGDHVIVLAEPVYGEEGGGVPLMRYAGSYATSVAW